MKPFSSRLMTAPTPRWNELEILTPPKVMLCFLSIHEVMAMVDRQMIDTNKHGQTNVPLSMCCFTSARMTDWKSLKFFLFEGDTYPRSWKLCLPLFKPWIFSGEKLAFWVFSALFSGANLGPTHSFGAKDVKLPVFWFKWSTSFDKKMCGFTTIFPYFYHMYCACITHCSTTCSTYKNIQVNIWLLGSWHWSYLKTT